MNYGFLINNETCIGCHACSTACKSENSVPLGVYRTWVKYTEVGEFPNSRRHFQVTRCNHCANPPCVRICPVQAMYQRDDGIVEFDPEICIGCKACMQACPYDAIYIDPESGTAQKCHFCAHRTEIGLDPACVVVCPEEAIVAGDLDDPLSEISQLIAQNKVTVRKPEQGTGPKLFYIDGNDYSMTPTTTDPSPETYIWADVVGDHRASHGSAEGNGASPGKRKSRSGTPIRTPQTQGVPSGGPIQIGKGRMAEQMVQVSYNAQHKVPWHWPVPAYLVTKGIGTGIFGILALAFLFGWAAFDTATAVAAGAVSLLAIGATTALLVYDLEKPERFLSILYRPQWKSWLTRGAFLLIGFSNILGLWWILEAAASQGTMVELAADLRPWLLGAGIPLSVGAAVYTAFLFGQAEGRDLWQSTLLPFHLVVQAAMAGGAALLMLATVIDMPGDIANIALITFGVALGVDLFVTLLGEFGMPHASEIAARAAHDISHGRYKTHFWVGSIVVGHLLPLALLFAGVPALFALAGALALVGLYLFEYAFVMAPQQVPNS